MKFYGISCDENSRCIHYNSDLDIVAIMFDCCKKLYCCYECHLALEDHIPQKWNRDTQCILCGKCSSFLFISEYLNSNNRCKYCCAEFNPKCSKHYDIYFSKDLIDKILNF